MKKVLNVFGVLGAVFLTIVLFVILSVYGIVLNLRFVVSKDGIGDVLNKIDVVETLKTIDDGVMWEDFQDMSTDLNLTEDQLEELVNSEAVKEEFGNILGDLVASITSEEPYKMTKDDFVQVLDTVIDEYNKVADEKIDKADRDAAVNEITDEFIDELNDSLAEVNLVVTATGDDVEAIKLVDYILFGAFSFALLITVIILIVLIVLCRWSVYKWMKYVGIGSLLASAVMLAIALFLDFVPINAEEMDVLMPFVNAFTSNMYMTALVFFIIYVVLIILERILKKQCNKKALKEDNTMVEQVDAQVDETSVDVNDTNVEDNN